MLVVEGQVTTNQPIVLTEFGGVALARASKDIWGYSQCGTPDEFLKHYQALLETVNGLRALAGFCYTQFTDTYQEANGLLYADRTPKASIEALAAATTGDQRRVDIPDESAWRDRLMERQR